MHLRFIHTSDVHGHVLDMLPRIASYIAMQRTLMPDAVVVTDGGDVLQGHAAAYYYNYVDTAAPHLVASAMNAVGYDAATIGNHDIETGHDVYSRWLGQCRFPVVAANVVDTATGEPHLKPYTIVRRQGMSIAILGMLTAAIPHWVPQAQRAGLSFTEMVSSVRHWVDKLRAEEQPDLIVGLFHSGWDADNGIHTETCTENATRLVATQVSGLDLILYGHDHRSNIATVTAPDGRDVACAAPTSNGARLVQVDMEVERDANGHATVVSTTAQLLTPRQMDTLTGPHAIDRRRWFAAESEAVRAYLRQPVGTVTQTLHERDALFGPSPFLNLVHDMQFELAPQADISLAAPLGYDATIEQGTLTVADIIKLYRFDNRLYTMRLTGREVLGLLEMSYDLWCNTMTSAADHILLLDHVLDGGRRLGLKNMAFNFEAAAGITYTVDASRPDGHKVSISTMADGTPFALNATYLVALNSYRGTGGGELITRGAGIPTAELPERIVATTPHDLRHHFIEAIRRHGTVTPTPRRNWSFGPGAWAPAALARDRAILFPPRNNREL